jgi:hypothetical protein
VRRVHLRKMDLVALRGRSGEASVEAGRPVWRLRSSQERPEFDHDS